MTTATESIALAAHAALLSVGARLVGLGEDHRIAAESDPDKPTPLPVEWRTQGGGGNYAFRYKHGQSSMEFLLKITRMGGKAVVMGMGVGDDRTCSFDIKATDYISEGNLPLTIPAATQSEDDKKEEKEAGGDEAAASSSNSTASGRFPTNADAERKVADLFISVGRLSDFGNLMRINIIQKLLPSLQKEGYQEQRSSASQTAADERERRSAHDPPRHDPLREDRDGPARPFPLHDPLAVPRPAPGRPLPDPIPGFEDEFEIQRPGRGMFPGGGGGGGFGRIGERDLYPQGLGPNDPIRGGIGPGLGGFGGGGMHPTFDDPLFGGQGQGGQGGGYDPRAPPGSRYDPVGPGGPGGGHPRGAGMGGRPPNPFGGFGGGDFI